MHVWSYAKILRPYLVWYFDPTVPLEVFFFLLRCNQAAFMEFVDELQFPRIKVLQLKTTLLRNLKHDREVLRETNVNKLDGNNIANAIEASNGSQNLRQSSVIIVRSLLIAWKSPCRRRAWWRPPRLPPSLRVATRAKHS